jgi:hypothetical protein
MEKSEIKAAILAGISEELDQWLERKDAITSGYEYETQLLKVSQKLNRLLVQHSVGKIPGSRNKKNSTPVLGKSK